MDVMHTHIEDTAILNGCQVRRTEASDDMEIILSAENYLTFTWTQNALIEISDLQFTGQESLYTLLEALERFAYYTRTKSISDANSLPTETIELLDNAGILDILIDRSSI